MGRGQLKIRTATSLVALMGLVSGWTMPPSQDSRSQGVSGSHASYSPSELEAFRQKGDLQSERRHVWAVFTHLTDAVDANASPQFESWYGEDAAFANAGGEPTLRGIRGFSRASQKPESVATRGNLPSQSADTPILSYTLYNFAAYEHIRSHRLHLMSELNRLRNVGLRDSSINGDRSIPPFPRASVVVKTAWWPVARDRFTPLPVWDPDRNPPRRAGNDYLSWTRVVAVDPLGQSREARTAPIEFAGQSFQEARRINLKAFYSVKVDADMARNLMLDQSAHKAALVVLGRPLQNGDYLILVGAHLATKEISEWVWGTLWWHDRAGEGPFAADRPAVLPSPWRNYLLQVAFDTDKPAALDGGPHICFNPWLEGRFPDAGHGGGTVSNCLACHRRASYPPVNFLPVTRGAPDLTHDPAYARGRLRTNFIWSIAMHSRP
jgi:hypothetical protein